MSKELVNTSKTGSIEEVLPDAQSAIAGTKILIDEPMNEDDQVILSLGYKPEFKRELTIWSTLGVAFSVLGLLPSIASTLFYSWAVVGNAGITWGFLVSCIGVIAVTLSMAEIASAFPTSGGLYYATAMLCPPKYKAISSWIVGYSNLFYQITGAPSIAYGASEMILSLASLGNPSYEYQTWHSYLLSSLIMIICSITASLPTLWIARISSVSSVLNMIFLIISWIFMLGGNNRVEQGLSRFNDNSLAWSLENQTDWPDGWAVLMSFMFIAWVMCGVDSPWHISEEVSNAATSIPYDMTTMVLVGCAACFIFLIAMAYTVVDVVSAVNDELGQPYIAYLNQIMGTKRVLAIGSFAAFLSITMSFSCMIAASRVLFAYSRDDCFPLSRYWCRVNKYTQTPVNAVWANCVIGLLLNLLMFGGAAIDAVFSVGSIAPFISFIIPVCFRLTTSRKTFKKGPWSLGKFSVPCGLLACAFVLILIPVSVWPQYKGADNTLELMNWTVVVYYGSMFLAIAWFYIYAHKIYKGPRSNIDNSHILSDHEKQ